MHISGFMGYSIINNRLYASYILNNGMFNKEIKVSQFKSDMKFSDVEENLKGLNWDATYTKLVVWSNCSLYIVSHESADVIANHARINRTLGMSDIKDKDKELITVCKWVRGTIVGLISPNIFF
jgi:hypothetical protein